MVLLQNTPEIGPLILGKECNILSSTVLPLSKLVLNPNPDGFKGDTGEFLKTTVRMGYWSIGVMG